MSRYAPPIRGNYLKRSNNNPMPSGLDLRMAVGGVTQLIMELEGIKSELLRTLDILITKIEEADTNLEEQSAKAKEITNSAIDNIAEIKTEAIEVIKARAIPGEKGDPAEPLDEDVIVARLESIFEAKIPEALNTEKLSQNILAKVPKLDTKKLTKQILKAIPQNKASLKIIQEKFEIDPMSVIEKIMSMPKGKFKLKTDNIDGLEQTMSAFRSQLGKGYLHGGGDTVAAGTNITLTRNPNGTVTISSSGGGFTKLDTASTVDGSNQSFIFLTATSQPTLVVSDGIQFTALDNNGNTQWSWNSGTKTVTLVTIAPPTVSIFAVQ